MLVPANGKATEVCQTFEKSLPHHFDKHSRRMRLNADRSKLPAYNESGRERFDRAFSRG